MLSPTPVTFKANTPSSPLPALPDWAVLAFRGRDAAAFLQAQLMNDVAALAPGQWQWNGWLNPKGRVIALFALLRTADEEFLVLVPDFPAEELRQRLQRYVFRSKVQIEVADALRCAAEIPEANPAHGPPGDRMQVFEGVGRRIDMGTTTSGRALWLLPADSPHLQAARAETASKWRSLDLAHGLPRLDPGQVEHWTPQMLALDRLKAFSLKKGCYPGQEIVARTHYLGKAKRSLARLGGTDLPSGAPVLDEGGREVGTIICAEAGQALAVLSVEIAAGQLNVNGQPLVFLPLLDGLQRPL